MAACKGGSSGSSSGKVADASLFASKSPPGDLAGIKAGMTKAEVAHLFPKRTKVENKDGVPSLQILTDYQDARFFVVFDPAEDRVAHIKVSVPVAVAKQARLTWGEPESPRGMMWSDDIVGHEVVVFEMHDETVLQYKLFVPATVDYFGATPGPFDALRRIRLGMTHAEVKAAAPGLEGLPDDVSYGTPFRGSARGAQLGVAYADNKVIRMDVRVPAIIGVHIARTWGPTNSKGSDGSAMNCWLTEDKTTSVEQSVEAPGRITFYPTGSGFCPAP